jgi:hypothetical protein
LLHTRLDNFSDVTEAEDSAHRHQVTQALQKLLDTLKTGLQHSSVKQVTRFFVSLGNILTHTCAISCDLHFLDSDSASDIFSGFRPFMEQLRESLSAHEKLLHLLDDLCVSMSGAQEGSSSVRLHQMRANRDGMLSSTMLDTEDWKLYTEHMGDEGISVHGSRVDIVEISERLFDEVYLWIEDLVTIDIEKFRLTSEEKKLLKQLVEISVVEPSSNHILDSGNFRKRYAENLCYSIVIQCNICHQTLFNRMYV